MTMHAPETLTRPTMRPYLGETAGYRSGKGNPRDFLERCLADLEAWEPKIGAFVSLSLDAARAAADASGARWRNGKPLSPIDGMPVGIKDIIETFDMPTEQGSPLFVGYRTGRDAASVAALREAGAVIVGKTVTTEFAATVARGTRNPWDLARTPGGSSSGSAAAVAVGILPVALGTQVIGSTIRPASYCGCYGFKPSVGGINRGGAYDYLSQSCTGTIAASLAEAWQVAYEIAIRAGGDPGYPGLAGPPNAPKAQKPRKLAVIETAGWALASPAARQAMTDALKRIAAAGVAIATRENDSKVAAVETAIAQARKLSADINAWEGRWPLNTYRALDASKLSDPALERLKQAEGMTPEEYRGLLRGRAQARALYAELAADVDATVGLSAPAAAPVGIGSTGEPASTVHTSYLGIPAISLPVLRDEGLPLGLQVAGFIDRDADTFAVAAWMESALG
jgi:Asp-tRNA(Asn)/Glu-tRNA(Gln) amidotransferase A subunit family amidase